MSEKKTFIKNVDIIIVMFLFAVLFILPVLFVREKDGFAWGNIFKIWQDYFLLIPLFVVNHWILVPKLMLKKKYVTYLILISFCIASITAGYYLYDENSPQKKERKPLPHEQREGQPPRPDKKKKPRGSKPSVPPYANLLFLSLMIVAVDTGLSFTKHWHHIEEEKVKLEKENIQSQLGMLRHQINPHFFMNTLNNIYALIEGDKKRSRESVMKLAKLMRYLLYENKTGKVRLSKEFEFIRNYIDLMKLRYASGVDIQLDIPGSYEDIEIPTLLFISYIENAFKYGVSYQRDSYVHVKFELIDESLEFTCDNSNSVFIEQNGKYGGIGLQNSKDRLELLYLDRYKLNIKKTDKIFSVIVRIPLK